MVIRLLFQKALFDKQCQKYDTIANVYNNGTHIYRNEKLWMPKRVLFAFHLFSEMANN